MSELFTLLTKFPQLVPAMTKIAEAFLKHDDPVVEAERQAEIIAAKAAIRSPFKEPKA
jgi:hypothetical protein